MPICNHFRDRCCQNVRHFSLELAKVKSKGNMLIESRPYASSLANQNKILYRVQRTNTKSIGYFSFDIWMEPVLSVGCCRWCSIIVYKNSWTILTYCQKYSWIRTIQKYLNNLTRRLSTSTTWLLQCTAGIS